MGSIHPIHASSMDSKEIINYCVSILMESDMADQYKDPDLLTKIATDQYNTIMPLFVYDLDSMQKDFCSIDFPDAASLEATLNKGGCAEGKTACITIKEINPEYFWGVNMWAGEHLNMLSKEAVDVDEGQSITIRVLKHAKYNNSWFITYVLVNGTKGSKLDTRKKNDKKTEDQKMESENAVVLAKIVSKLETFRDQLEEIRENEQDIFDELTERQQESKKGQALQEEIDNLDTAYSDLDDAISALEDYTDGIEYKDDDEIDNQKEPSVQSKEQKKDLDFTKTLRKNIEVMTNTFEANNLKCLGVGCKYIEDKKNPYLNILVEISTINGTLDSGKHIKINLYDDEDDLFYTESGWINSYTSGFDTIEIKCEDKGNIMWKAIRGKLYVTE